jgi:hypothetical protein
MSSSHIAAGGHESLSHIPETLLEPTYQNRLRVIGRHLDLLSYRSFVIVEVEGGLLVRAMRADQRDGEALEFPDGAFRQLMLDAIGSRGSGYHSYTPSPLLPTGYEDFLRALGHRLDQRLARGIVITECPSMIVVTGDEQGHTSSQAPYRVFEDLLRPQDVTALLDQAFSRRAPVQAADERPIDGAGAGLRRFRRLA